MTVQVPTVYAVDRFCDVTFTCGADACAVEMHCNARSARGSRFFCCLLSLDRY